MDAVNAQVDDMRRVMVIALCVGMLALPLPAASQSAPAGHRATFTRPTSGSIPQTDFSACNAC
jgi:hypothetical protein